MIFLHSSYFQLLLMGKLRHGFMITWDLGLIMMLLDMAVRQCFIVLMVQGKENFLRSAKLSPTICFVINILLPLNYGSLSNTLFSTGCSLAAQ